MAEARRAIEPLPARVLTGEIDPTLLTFQLRSADKGWALFIPRPKYIALGVARAIRNAYRKLQLAFVPLPISLVAAATMGASLWVAVSPAAAAIRHSTLARTAWNLDSKNPIAARLPHRWRVFYLAFNVTGTLMLGVTVVHRMLLRTLLSYTGWVDEPRGKPSMWTKVWAALLKYLYIRGGTQLTMAYQSSLPTLPVPALGTTVARYLESMEGTLSAEEMADVRHEADEFLRNEGPTLQRYVWLRSLWVTNYVSDWWLNYVYLMSRDSLMINSNYYGLGPYVKPLTPYPESRAAYITQQLILLSLSIDRDTFPPIIVNNLVPFCMEQYSRAYRTTRIPGAPMDRLRTYEAHESRHIVVVHRGRYYAVRAFSETTGRVLSAGAFEAAFQRILNDPSVASAGEQRVAALTASNRSQWATIRADHFLRDAVNREALDLIERSLFVVVFDDSDIKWSDLSAIGHRAMHADGCSIWLDKSMTIIFTPDGNVSTNAEHSWGDAMIIAHLFELIASRELFRDAYASGGRVTDRSSDVVLPERIQFNFTDELQALVDSAALTAKRSIEDLDLDVRHFTAFGKGRVKASRCSPDSFIQMALQVAYFRDQHKFTQTYEAAATRFFRNGRTETIRSCSRQSIAFVQCLDDPAATREQKLAALRLACEHHHTTATMAATGRGVDRHLFALYVAAVGTGRSSPFLTRLHGRGWKLSTSQVPLYQSPHEWPRGHNPDKFPRPSGGFGPVADDGYGVSYAVNGEDSFFFHVSSKHSAPNTSSARMADNIFRALNDMAALL